MFALSHDLDNIHHHPVLAFTERYITFITWRFQLSFIILFALLYFGTCYVLLKALSVEVALWFDEHYLYLRKGKGFRSMLKLILQDCMP
ncbi:hypothetical protein EJ377_13875 (plasmid) [Chryseobacterium arthrosphaerae]|uniref:Uncharacterized protein n=1 Tax=Chryseobacterium arthrosphaerae TaxID=651561 RepID=A0A432DY55_9FLAO|nr:hypothetical protein EJ377_13875 [Chryseobacterium arthrosphaerae]